MATKPVKNETAEKASAMLRRIADMIDASDMGIASMGLIPHPPQRAQLPGRMIEPYQLSIDLEFFIVSQTCAAFVDEIRG